MSEKKFPKLYCPMCDKELNENHKMLVQKAMLLMMSPIGNNFEFQGKELWCEKCFDDLSNEKCVIKND